MDASIGTAYARVSTGGARRPEGRHELLCTLGPASLHAGVIHRLEEFGASLFRVNLSHTQLGALPSVIETIREATTVPICLDTEGAQIRTGELVHRSIELRDNTVVRVHFRRVPGDDRSFNLYPRDVARLLEPGDFLSIDFNSALVQVVGTDNEGVSMRVLRGGLVGQNKGVSLERSIPMPALTEKDRAAVELGRTMGLSHFALSFARSRQDVRELRALVGDDAFVISKIESLPGLDNLEEIAAESDALLIDRGDLSRQVPIEVIPQTQKWIIRRAKAVGSRVYVATNLLESMVSAPTPTRAEVNDIHTTLTDGADGLVLAAETAIGKYPVQCASLVRKMLTGFEQDELDVSDAPRLVPVSLLPEPHGGRLVRRIATDADLAAVESLPSLRVSDHVLMDCEQIAHGTYSPVTGFMDHDTVRSVLSDCRLPGGEAWTLPITLQRQSPTLDSGGVIREGQRLALADDGGVTRALLDVTQVYRCDLRELAAGIFGTSSPEHPGAARMLGQGNVFLAGDVTLVEPLANPNRHYFLTPEQTRFVFSRLGWSRVVGFHTRNPAHRGHEAIQLQALEQTAADGIYINPVASAEKPGDFLPEPVLLTYQTLVEFGHYPKGKVVLGGFFTYARYAGPREAVFTALCRKNMGCSHFIIGRDHAGVGDYYSPRQYRELFDRLGDIGVTPVFFDAVGYDPERNVYEAGHEANLVDISGSQVRQALRSGERLPDWFMRELVQEVLQMEIQSGRPVFRE